MLGLMTSICLGLLKSAAKLVFFHVPSFLQHILAMSKNTVLLLWDRLWSGALAILLSTI